ncbi:hypothetical protein ANN_23321 [Periplaneta americana]|uniref:Uncharacterized protein n=1 Tax=Periplaneta americana TaxID=6978 RepID=A0ABQ8SM86_PERAM|nr:hypothetical protein ANN_23321 [Periplaneta americana]
MAGLCEGGNEPSGSLKAICGYDFAACRFCSQRRWKGPIPLRSEVNEAGRPKISQPFTVHVTQWPSHE